MSLTVGESIFLCTFHLSFSNGTFFEQLCRHRRKLQPLLIIQLLENEQKNARFYSRDCSIIYQLKCIQTFLKRLIQTLQSPLYLVCQFWEFLSFNSSRDLGFSYLSSKLRCWAVTLLALQTLSSKLTFIGRTKPHLLFVLSQPFNLGTRVDIGRIPD